MSQWRGLIEDVGNWSGNKIMGKVLAESRRLGIKRPAGGLLLQRHLILKKSSECLHCITSVFKVK